jgi:hypothetical protein
MVMSTRHIRRRQVPASAAGGSGLLMLPGKAPAQGGTKPLAGVTLNVSCWSSSYPQYPTNYIPEFEQATGAKVIYETPSFPIYNQRTDIELSTKSDAHDVITVTFTFSGRWVGAGWFVPRTGFVDNQKKRRRTGTRTIFCLPPPRLSRIVWAGCARFRGSPTSIWPAPRVMI